MSTKNKFLYGLDISLSCTGVAIYDLEKREFVFIGSFSTAHIKAQKNRYHNALKLRELGSWLESLIEQYPPFYVAIEKGFSQFNIATQVLFRAHGVINLIFWDYPQKYYPVLSVKEYVVHGKATKEDLKNTINTKYNYIFKNEDESDAFSVALAALIENELIEWEKPDFAAIVAMRVEKPKKSHRAQRQTKAQKALMAQKELADKKQFCTTFLPGRWEPEELALKTKLTLAEMYRAYADEVIEVLIEDYGMKKKEAKQLLVKDRFKEDFMKDWRDFEFVEPSEVARVAVRRAEDEK